MDQHSRIEDETRLNMTRKGQVLIPKAVRDRNGLVPGEPVRVGTNDRGETVVLPLTDRRNETPQQRSARIRAAAEALAGKYANGESTDEYMRWLRGDWEP